MNKIKITVSGGMGRMGRRICRLIEEDSYLKLAYILESANNKYCDKIIDGVSVTDNIDVAVDVADVIIDFSCIDAAMKTIDVCLKKNKKIVIGTTGFSPEQLKEISEAAKTIPILLSPNMSIGINLVFKLIKKITANLPGYEKEIIEAHHNQKIDSPSGTALKIAEIISSENDKLIFGRKGNPGPRQNNEIGIHAVRGGNIIGDHTVMWIGPYEKIELSHSAQSRDVFASGAIRAAVWLNEQKSGRLFNMQDLSDEI